MSEKAWNATIIRSGESWALVLQRPRATPKLATKTAAKPRKQPTRAKEAKP